MDLSMRALYALCLGSGVALGLAGCSVTTAPSPPVVVQTAPPAASGMVVTPGSAVVVQPPRY